jgi:F0F1-type ATP synthase delta subunit
MKTSRKALADVICRQTLSGHFGSKQVMSVAAYLLEAGQTGALNSLLRDVQADWASRGVIEVVATSAHELTNQVISDIEQEVRKVYPHAERIVVTRQLDPDVVGGVRLSFVEYSLDLSVAGDLQKFKTLAVYGKE